MDERRTLTARGCLLVCVICAVLERRGWAQAPLGALAEKDTGPGRPPYTIREGGSRLCFVRDPDSCFQTLSQDPTLN